MGIGLFRLGIKKKLPSFLIQGYLSGIESVYQKEDNYDWEAFLERKKNYKPPLEILKGLSYGQFNIKFDPLQIRIGRTIMNFRSSPNRKDKIVLSIPINAPEVVVDLSEYPGGIFQIEFIEDGKFYFIWTLGVEYKQE